MATLKLSEGLLASALRDAILKLDRFKLKTLLVSSAMKQVYTESSDDKNGRNTVFAIYEITLGAQPTMKIIFNSNELNIDEVIQIVDMLKENVSRLDNDLIIELDSKPL